MKWERIRRQNHWFDAIYNACAAGSFCGARLVEEPKPKRERKPLAYYNEQAMRRKMEMNARW